MTLHSNQTNVRATWDYAGGPDSSAGAVEPLPSSPPMGADAGLDPTDPLVGRTLDGRYYIKERIGEGTFGTVYRGYHQKLCRPVAIKVLSNTIAIHPQWVRRFEQEAQILARVATEQTVNVYDSGEDAQAGYYIVMEYLHGTDLADWIDERGPLGVLDFYAVLDQVGEALRRAHHAGVIHLDIKSENIFLLSGSEHEETMSVKLLDFGISRLTAAREAEGDEAPCGSPYTMSPEAIRGLALDHRSDIYSLGAVLYEALTGLPPFDATSVQSLLFKHLFEAPTAASHEEDAGWVIPEADELLKRMLAKAPEDRPENLQEVVDGFLAIRDAMEHSWAKHYLLPTTTEEDVAPHRSRNERQRMRTMELAPNEVVVVDDDPLYRQVVRRALTRKGFRVFSTGAVHDAVSHLELRQPAAVVMDLLMPVDGVTAIRMIRRGGFTGPIYVLSGLCDTEVARVAMSAGASQAFRKDQFGELTAALIRDRATAPQGARP